MDRFSIGGGQPRGRPVSGLEAAHANEYFEPFLNATTLKNILGYHRSMCDFLHLKPNVFPHFYPKLRANLTSWRAKALWKKFDARASHKCYGKGKACAGTRVLIIGAGPCGLRTAIEAQLLGAKVVVVEKRDRLSRNNVLHLWPFVIEDLRMLGAKKFFGKFCAGAIDHISIRQLQCILLKVALLLGVEVHTEVSFERLLEPSSVEKTGWRAQILPENHPVAQYEFDVIIGADGKRNTLQGFKRKEFRGKLAIAITANFINKKTEAEARVEEISGVAFIFNQKFFKDLQEETRIDLENIVYYKDDTHYFVMTAKKASLLEKGVIKQDLADTEKLLAPDNVDRDALQNYARQAADFSTNYQLPELEFAVNHYGQPDVAMFDFTSMYAAEYASKVVERNGSRLLMILVGDSLLEPFWPTGSGCARGFLSSLDAAWAIRSYCSGQMTPLDVLAERESIYRLLAQTTPDNLNKDWKSYTLDPATRYPNLNKSVVNAHQTTCLYDTDNVENINKMKRASLEAASRQEHVPKKRRRGNVDNEVLINWLSDQLRDHEDVIITDLSSVFRNGKTLCAIIHHYRPDLLDYSAIKDIDAAKCNQLAMDTLEKDLGVPPFMTGEEITNTDDYLAMATYLSQVYDTFRGEIPHIKHPKVSPVPFEIPISPKSRALLNKLNLIESKYSQTTIITGSNVNSAKSKLVASTSKMKSRSGDLAKQKIKIPTIKAKKRTGNPSKTLSEHTFLTASIQGVEHVKIKKSKKAVEDYFDLPHNDDEVKRQKKVKKAKSRNVAISVNLLSPASKKVKTPSEKKASKLSVITENIDDGAAKAIASKAQRFRCETFIQNPFDRLALPKIPNETEHERNAKTQQPSFSLKNLSPLQLIRKHLQLKRRQLGRVLSRPKVFPAFRQPPPRVHELISTSSHSVNIQIIHRRSDKRDKVTLENVEYKSSRNLVQITSEGLQEKRLKQIFDNKAHQLKGKLAKPRFPDWNVPKTVKTRMIRKKPSLTRTDAIIIEKLGTCLTETSCQRSAVRRKRGKKRVLREISESESKLHAKMHQPLYGGDEVSVSSHGFSRVQNWISQHDFKEDGSQREQERDNLIMYDIPSDITSISRVQMRRRHEYDGVKVEERTDVIKCDSSSQEDFTELVKNLKNTSTKDVNGGSGIGGLSIPVVKSAPKFSQFMMKSVSAPPAHFSVIVEGEESELPESNKRSEFSFKSIKTTSNYGNNHHHTAAAPLALSASRPSSRHKRHAEVPTPKPTSVDRKQRKRRTMEKIGPSIEERQRTLQEIASNRADRQSKRKQQRRRQTEQFLKSMQMLQANCKPDQSEPFEDYSIFLYRQTAPKFQDRVKDLEKQFTYVPDYDSRATGLKPLTHTNAEEDIASKIRSLEDKWSSRQPAEKKPKDLLRAIGKIETSDWNIKQIEKKILENKLGKPSSLNADKERVPRWSKEEFRARQTKMENKHLDGQDAVEAKYADIDRNIKQLELKLKEGTNRELGQNKVASITEKLASKVPQEKDKPIEKPPQAKPVNLPIHSGSEYCHFCDKRVYLMERLSAEGRFFHHGCFKCQYCHTQLRLGSYMFDRDGQYGYRFFCIHHYGMQGELPRPTKLARKQSQKGVREAGRSPQKKPLAGVAGVDLLDRVQTPERIEFSNLSTGNVSSDHEEPLSQMDEDEWTDKNFGASCNELEDSDESSSSLSDTDSDDEDAFDDALEQPITKEGTMKWAERWKNSYRKGRHSDSDGYSSSDHSSYYENSSDDSDSETATEGEEEIRARELRKQEVRVEPPLVQTDTGTDTEVKKTKTVDLLPPPNPESIPPDILNDHHKRIAPVNKSPSNYSINSEIFTSAESDLDMNQNVKTNGHSAAAVAANVVVGKFSIPPPKGADAKPPPKPSPLAKSATAGNIGKVKRNFVLPPKEQRRCGFGQEFEPKFKLEEPLLVIRRTPSKVNLPKEIKPKVAVNTKVLDTKKYFGAAQPNKLQRSGTSVKVQFKPPLIKQNSLPETTTTPASKTEEAGFNFDLKESDLKDVDGYIEDLLAKEDELEKPIDPLKYAAPPVAQNREPDELSSSIEDLFSALEKETEAPDREIQKQSEEKVEDLLKWMEELDHQIPERKVYRSVSDAKYKNLESLLKKPHRSGSVVSKLPKNNVAFFEAILKGKDVPKDPTSSSDENLATKAGSLLSRSRTETSVSRQKYPRTSVDLDAVSKVDIKSVLQKFESMDQDDQQQEETKPKPKLKKTTNSFRKPPLRSNVKAKETVKSDEKSFEETIKDLEKFVDDTIQSIGNSSRKSNRPKSGDLGKSKSDWCVNVTVSSKVSPEFLKLQQEAAEKAHNQTAIAPTAETVSTEVKEKLHEEATNKAVNGIDGASDGSQVKLAPAVEHNQSDMVKELEDFDEAVSAFTEDTSSNDLPLNFGKAVDSSDNSSEAPPEPSNQKNIEDMYATVNKQPKKVCVDLSPPVPVRRKHSAPLPPPRPMRQKSGNSGAENNPPPLPRRRSELDELKPLNANGKSTSTGTLEVKKAVVTSYDLPGPQKMVSEESSSESSEIQQNSATEISTDSEFAQDDPTPTREIPSIALNDFYVTKKRGSGRSPKRIQVTTGYIQRARQNENKNINNKSPNKQAKNPRADIELKLSPLVPSTPSFKPALLPTLRGESAAGYALNRTQSTGGIAAKVSLELKKKYLLGESGANSIQKSGSASTLDTKFKSFQTTISDCQKLLKPAPEISASMQMFCNKLDERLSPVQSPQAAAEFTFGSKIALASESQKDGLPPPDITITSAGEQNKEEKESAEVALDWSKHEESSGSLSLSEGKEDGHRFDIPRVEIHPESDLEMAPDSLCPVEEESLKKSVTSEKKKMNQPKSLPNLESVLPEIHKALHVKLKSDKEDSPEDSKSVKSGKSSPEVTTAALTETELSDWAREDVVSDSIELDMSQASDKSKKLIKIAQLSEFEDVINRHVCGKDSKELVNKTILTEAMNDALSGNLDNIEYMDTGTETSSDDANADSQNGYVLFKNEEDMAEDSLNPQINREIFEAKNVYLIQKEEQPNRGYCELVTPKPKAAVPEPPEDDSLLILETGGTTTEENTCSDSTVKNLTEVASANNDRPSVKIENLQKQRLEEKLAKVKAELKETQQEKEFEEHCQRLQSKVEFGNARDSLDVRKSRRKSKSEAPPVQKPDLIREETTIAVPVTEPKDITLTLSPVIQPDVIYKKETIKKERDVNKKLIEEMVMNKMKAQNKSLERKKRPRSSFSPARTSILTPPTPTSGGSTYVTPDLLPNSVVDTTSSNEKYITPSTSTPKPTPSTRPLSIFSTFSEGKKLPDTPLTHPENFSMPDIRRNLLEEFKTPKAPPRHNRPSDMVRTAEKMKENARARARLLSNEDLGLSPEDKLIRLREKANRSVDVHVQESIESLVLNTERRNSLLYSNDTLTKKRNNGQSSFRRSKSGDSGTSGGGLTAAGIRPKSVSELSHKSLSTVGNGADETEKKICKSDPNLLSKKKSKDRERRKSITKLIAGIFTKKSPTNGTAKGLFAKLSPKSKATSKDVAVPEPKPAKSLTELRPERLEPTPPPVPPLPDNYTMKATDDSSDGEMLDGKSGADRGSCDTLDQSTVGRRSGKARRFSRQAQLKRHRMAQEIQRKLEETEVKTRELEQRGVEVEKALRGEDEGRCVKDESELLQEWFDLMRDRTELRRYERELMIRAQELQLEDRHSRLQMKLRERLESNEEKTDEDLNIEKSIINEMMEIVAKRDNLIAVLEEDRQRYSHEDKDLEEQMLAKGLMLTPIEKSPEK